MNCNLSCALAVGIIFASLFTMIGPKNEINKLNQLIDPKTAKIYSEIKYERLKIYIIGLILGVLCAYLFLKYYSGSESNSMKICTFVLIAGVIQIVFYEIMPKSKWMLDYLQTPGQNKQWLRVYKSMKNRWHLGFFIGIIGFIFLGNGLCNL